ncbi:MAG TPA: right-handed parallel beta-helix repeat-containing protein [Solirubrobacteraceae bacterium]|nr:right-handed parallel beta-helix repeat-containing protein [Solirubrobacteraceae bacterium]
MHTRMTVAVGVVGASLAFTGTALAAPAPFVPHARHDSASHHQLDRAAVTPATGSATLYVNGTTGDDESGANTCRLSTHPCKTIGQAISIAPSVATIKVAAGNYPEQLTISGKKLSIVGAGASTTTIDPSTLTTVDNDPDSPGNPEAIIVDFENTSGGGLSNVTVDGSNATEPSDNSCDLDYVGVQLVDSTAKLSGDTVTGIVNSPAFFGCQGGLGVYVANSNGDPQTVTMSKLNVSDYDKNGITCDDAGSTCLISASKVTGIGATDQIAQNGIQFYGGSGTVKNSTVTANSYTSPNFTLANNDYYTASGILLYDAGAVTLSGNHVNHNDDNIYGYEDGTGVAQGAWTISKNTVTAGTNNTGQGSTVRVPLGYGVGDGIDLAGTTATTAVYGNTVNGNADWGIALFGANGATIGGTATGQRNTVSKNADDGIWLGEFAAGVPSTNNTVTNNLVKGNQDDGILAAGPDSQNDQQATGNTFDVNVLEGNLRYDAEDLSTGGTGPGGVANTWTGNACTPTNDSSPLGLCG